jgi:hypothetical protein
VIRWMQGRKVHRLCDRWRAAMSQLEEPAVANATDEELLVGLQQMVAAENPGISAKQLVKGTLWLLEASTIGAEQRLEAIRQEAAR